ncbi:acyl-CoA dehydrogenase family protein [Myxococcota bacterium]|nr:acyl-CoA dehydrogenase family protein [Myxococcota bacterium]
MDFSFDAEVEAFREEVRGFFREELSEERTRGHFDPRDLTGFDEAFERAHQRRAGERGYLGISAPSEFGGGGRPLSFQAAFGFEAAYHEAPCVDTAMTLVGAVMQGFGSAEQKVEYLPQMIRGEILMSIGYSEATAGSDLSGIAMRARLLDDGFELEGTKTLVTGAHKAEVMCLIARTDPDVPTRQGSSLFLVDLSLPGVEIERRATLNGWTLCDVHFRGVHVERKALLGELHGGWQQMAAALTSERSQLFHVGWAARDVDDLIQHCRSHERGGRLLCEDPFVRRELSRLRVEVHVALRFAKRVIWLQDQGRIPGHEAATAKLYATELLQRVAATGSSILGPHAALARGAHLAPLGGRMGWARLERIHGTISVGSNELQRSAIAQMGLGMPRNA